METVSYFKKFVNSKYHAFLAGGCILFVALMGNLFGLLLGTVAYILGMVYVHDLQFFKDKVDAEISEKERAEKEAKIAMFRQKRDQLFESLTKDNKTKYNKLSAVCNDIRKSVENTDTEGVFSSKIDEIMFTYLRLIAISESLNALLLIENDQGLDAKIKQVESSVHDIDVKILDLSKDEVGNATEIAHQKKLGDSVKDKLLTLVKRKEKMEDARRNIELVNAEQERLDEQIQTVRAEAVASRNMDVLSMRIDASITNLGQTKDLLDQLKDYTDLTESVPAGAGFAVKNDMSFMNDIGAVGNPDVEKTFSYQENPATVKKPKRNSRATMME